MLRNLFALALLAASAALLWVSFSGEQPPPASVPVEPESVDWYPQRDWPDSAPATGKVSVFIFRDRNRDGILDSGDLPMASVAVALERPDGSYRTRRSNINGYTNFTVQAGGTGEDITEPGASYRWTVQVPPGWTITTTNGEQQASFRPLGGTPAGMVTDTPPAVVGLAPELTATGSFPALPDTPLVASASDGTAVKATTDASGRFELTLSPGAWTIRRADAKQALRRFTVKDAPVQLAAGAREPGTTGREPRWVDFEVLDRAIIEKLPMGYAGLGWDYLLAIDNQHYRGPGYVNVLTSGRTVGYNSSGYPVTITGLAPGERFDFEGGYFAVAWPQAEGEILEVEGWRGGEPVYRDELTLSFLGPSWLAADYRDIDRLVLRTRHYWQFSCDDLVFGVTPPPLNPALPK
ncbi:hypothetical protein [Pseudohaliea rubra]|uniref:SD-repeat containing protein B domain-containing protein n=1 Tax=Pseudohaliea rubra DSM 19751 TaxID=1265313 RepID=A0A095VT50_9GAMM|nr:hypothetical protein [Pseudohaliea rubra]KGE04535.1 hypothetical protein HRUBRA_00874 [Pseudohaliea rubra DSM 19751]